MRQESVGLESVARIAIFRQGSLGDTIVALPCFHLIERCFPNADRRLLTNHPISRHIAPAADLLANAGLIHGTIEYPVETRDRRALVDLYRRFRAFAPEVVVYLVESRTRLQRIRDILFLRACGSRRIVGASIREDVSTARVVGPGDLRESETLRLSRAIRGLGDAAPDNPANWDLRLTPVEFRGAAAALGDGIGRHFIAFSIGTKWPTNDYENSNWMELLLQLAQRHPNLPLVAIGSQADHDRSEALLRSWRGPTINLCGRLLVRETAALLRRATLFIGHDSGPMHLAACVGTPCVAIFSARNPPGIWFPRGQDNLVFYQEVSCAGCGLFSCTTERKRCILSISPQSVAEAVGRLLIRCFSDTLAASSG